MLGTIGDPIPFIIFGLCYKRLCSSVPVELAVEPAVEPTVEPALGPLSQNKPA